MKHPTCQITSDFSEEQILEAMGPEGRDRRFAQWVLDRGGKLIEENGKFPELKTAEAAAKCEGTLRAAFSSVTDLDDADLEAMSRMRPSRPIKLSIIDCKAVTSAGVRHLKGFDILSLNLGGTSMTDDAAGTIVGFSNLNKLDITNTRMTSASFKQVMGIDSLRFFSASGLEASSDDLVDLKHSHLVALSMLNTRTDATGLDFLTGLPALEALQIGYGTVRGEILIHDADVATLSELVSLEDLMLNGTNISDDGVRYLSELAQLQRLKLLGSQMTDDGLRELVAGRSELTLLAIDGSRVTNDGLLQVLELEKLTSLAVSGCERIDSAGFAVIGRVTRLEYLFAARTSFSDTDLQAISGLASLAHLDISDTQVTDAGVETLSALKSLRVLNVKLTKITSDGIVRLRAALPNCDIRVK